MKKIFTTLSLSVLLLPNLVRAEPECQAYYHFDNTQASGNIQQLFCHSSVPKTHDIRFNFNIDSSYSSANLHHIAVFSLFNITDAARIEAIRALPDFSAKRNALCQDPDHESPYRAHTDQERASPWQHCLYQDMATFTTFDPAIERPDEEVFFQTFVIPRTPAAGRDQPQVEIDQVAVAAFVLGGSPHLQRQQAQPDFKQVPYMFELDHLSGDDLQQIYGERHGADQPTQATFACLYFNNLVNHDYMWVTYYCGIMTDW
ncbi:MAG: hypothetical protein ISP86_01275 [Shewanellaceae bacterium]|nr:hypothetical protein [Shewanellaceae bacterium]